MRIRVRGRLPVPTTVALKVRFEINGMTLLDPGFSWEPIALSNDFMFRARELHELDRVPRPVANFPPPNPAAAGEPAMTGRARVDFFIDENGQVRMPVVATADAEQLGWAALAAIAKWQFEVPLRGGRTVLARAGTMAGKVQMHGAGSRTERAQAPSGGPKKPRTLRGDI